MARHDPISSRASVLLRALGRPAPDRALELLPQPEPMQPCETQEESASPGLARSAVRASRPERRRLPAERMATAAGVRATGVLVILLALTNLALSRTAAGCRPAQQWLSLNLVLVASNLLLPLRRRTRVGIALVTLLTLLLALSGALDSPVLG